jgi:hypothetical protein
MEEGGNGNENHNGSDGTGYRRPPKSTRFAKGKSGNPAGRPPGRHRHAPYEAVLGQMVTIREGGRTRRVTGTDAFLLNLAKRGVEGDGLAARASLELIDQAKSEQRAEEISIIVLKAVAVGGVTCALDALTMAIKLYPLCENARWALEPWLVEAALARLSQPLTADEQRIVLEATLTPHKVRWPQWWSEFP